MTAFQFGLTIGILLGCCLGMVIMGVIAIAKLDEVEEPDRFDPDYERSNIT